MKGVFKPIVGEDDDIYFGEGVYYIDFGEVSEKVLGATQGGGKIEIEKSIDVINYDGKHGATKGLRKFNRLQPKMTVSLLKNTHETITEAVNADYLDETDYYKVTFRVNIEDADYPTNITFVGKTLGGKNIIAIVKNPFMDGNIEMESKEKTEVIPELVYTGHYLSTTPTTPPYEIWEYDV